MASDQALIQRTPRLFLALWPDDTVRLQLVDHVGQWTWSAVGMRYLPEDWHVTLHFIGQVNADQVANITTSAAVPFKPFKLILDQPTLWPHGLAVLCASEVPVSLQALYERLGNTLHALGLAVETRPYQPHITLARRVPAAIVPTKFESVVWWVRRYVLVASTGSSNPRYRVLHQYG